MDTDKPSSIKEAILLSYGYISAIFMSQDINCRQVVMPTEELEQQANELVNSIENILMEYHGVVL